MMTILLPARGEDVNELVASLTAEAWAKHTSGLYAYPGMQIGLPKFRLEWEAELNAELKLMGMPLAFRSGKADFSRISPDPQLRISAVVQKTFVDVNEEGTEAAAATAVIMNSPSAPPSFIVDRPFVFAIRSFGGSTDKHRKEVRCMLLAVGNEIGTSSDATPKGQQELNQEGGRVGFRVRLDG